MRLWTRGGIALLVLLGLRADPGWAQELPPAPHAAECVVLLHGLGRTAKSFARMQAALEKDGYRVIALDYASRRRTIEELAAQELDTLISALRRGQAQKIHFVTHSMGGILLRYYLTQHALPELGRVVMLGPPNRGSEVADFTARVWPVNRIFGPNLARLKTAPGSFVNGLGPCRGGEIGVIAGDRSINWINSLVFIHGRDDGKVSVVEAKLQGMKEFRVVHVSHPFLMRNRGVIRLVQAFLAKGSFGRDATDRAPVVAPAPKSGGKRGKEPGPLLADEPVHPWHKATGVPSTR